MINECGRAGSTSSLVAGLGNIGSYDIDRAIADAAGLRCDHSSYAHQYLVVLCDRDAGEAVCHTDAVMDYER
jgi:hypothetical protein